MKKTTLLFVFASMIYSVSAQLNPGGVTGSTLWLRADKAKYDAGTKKLVAPDFWEDLSSAQQQVELFQKTEGVAETLEYKENGVNFNPTVYFNGKVGIKGLENKKYQSVFAVYSATLNVENKFESTALSIQEKDVTSYGAKEDLAFFQTYIMGTNPTHTWLVADGINSYWGTRGAVVSAKATDFHLSFAAFGNPSGDLVTLDGGLFSKLTRFVNTPSKEGKFYVGVSVAGTTKIGKWLEGDVAEVIAFDRLITDEERYKVESYLALKYGITLHKTISNALLAIPASPTYKYNYLNSKGDIVWNGENADYSPYSQYITGIMRDDASGLNQIKSRGRIGYTLVDNEGILTIANGASFDQPQNFTQDGQYAIVGATSDKLTATSLVQAVNENNEGISCLALNRKWKINISGTDKVSVKFDFTSVMQTSMAEAPRVGILKITNDKNQFIAGVYDAENKCMVINDFPVQSGDEFTVVLDYTDKPKLSEKSQKLCLTSVVNLIGTPAGGVFAGDGMSDGTFTASVAGVGAHTITYTVNGMSSDVTFTVEENIQPEVTLVPSRTEASEWDAIVIEAQTITGGTAPLYQFSIDDPSFAEPTESYSSNNILRLAGYQLTEGEHTIYVRMKSSLPCATTELATNLLTIAKTSGSILVVDTEKITCYPNPFKDEIYVSGLQDKNYVVQVYDINNRLMYSNIISSQQNKIMLYGLIPGSYIVQLIDYATNTQEAIMKVVK